MMLPTVGCGLASSDKRDLAIGVRNAAGPTVCVIHDSNNSLVMAATLLATRAWLVKKRGVSGSSAFALCSETMSTIKKRIYVLHVSLAT